MTNYGNSFGNKRTEPVEVERITLWDTIYERVLVGATLKASDSYPEGTVIPAGTPIARKDGVVGGEAVLNSATPEGLTEEDVVMGSDFCTFSIVKRGVFYESRTKATITAAQKKVLSGITFEKGV